MGKFIDITGQKFGRWTVLSRAKNQGTRTMWEAQCECGKTREVSAIHIRWGRSKSCGCINVEKLTVHGLYKSPERGVWSGMQQRCTNPRSPEFHNYGGRGIRICQRWKSFGNFYADIGPRPSSNLSIDRIDNNGHYSCGNCEECRANGWPANCRWATTAEQFANRRNSCLLTYGGKPQVLAQWETEYNLTHGLLKYRIKAGWTIEQALSLPAEKGRLLIHRL